MPKNLYDIRNYPRRSGTSQPGRYKAVLQGADVKLDERTIADFILFAQRLSKHLKYYNLNNVVQGSWEFFLKSDITYHLAITSADKSKQWEDVWRELMENVEGANGAPATDNDRKKYFTWRFDFLYTLLAKMTATYTNSNTLDSWKNDLLALLSSSHLGVIYYLLQAYYKSSESLLLPASGAFTFKDISLLKKATADQEISLSPEWVKELLEVDPLFDNTDFIFGAAVSVAEKISAASEYLNDLAFQLIRLYNSLNVLAEKYLSFTLQQFNSHEPHVGLFFAFLQLADEHKNEVNGLLLKHLDFYYKQVLLVKEKSWQPDRAFVTFTLAKNVNEHFISAGSLLAAGKDTGKKDVFYKTLQDILVNKAEVAEIKSFTIISDANDNTGQPEKNLRSTAGLFGAPSANSLDGKGKPLAPGQSWETFRSTSAKSDVNQQVGISFYSTLLFESAGETRNFALRLKFIDNSFNNKAVWFIQNYGTLKILTDKEPLTPSLTTTQLNNGIDISFSIDGKAKIEQTIPNASLVFGSKGSVLGESFFEAFKLFQTAGLASLQLVIKTYSITATQVETVAGTTDVSSPFPPFGGEPSVGSFFTIVEPLLKGKSVSTLSVEVEWATKTEAGFAVNITSGGTSPVKGQVQSGNATTSFNFITGGQTLLIFGSEIKVELLDDLGHRSYGKRYFEAGIESMRKASDPEAEGVRTFVNRELEGLGKQAHARSSSTVNFPELPYTPVIKSITLTGTFAETILSNTNFVNVYNSYPFGIKKFKSFSEVRLLPSFFTSGGQLSSKASEGELYIGFKNIVPSQSLNVLIAVEEGSADPELQNPDVTWTFLQNDEWASFPESQFHDGTSGLIQSGLLSMIIPEVDINSHLLLSAGIFWLRATVPFNESNAVARIISVHTQAVIAEFNNQGNDPLYLGTNIPPNTVTNLFPKRAAVQKVSQPFASSGGKKNEVSSHLYIRTSERLRHKGRGVTAWDYENVILEAFPEIYKVKVLHHACPYKGATNKTEKIVSKAGSLIVLVMPKTAAVSSIYKPMVSKSKLTSIYNFIRPRTSPFTLLSVMNPLFEEIALTVEVVFAEHIQDRLFYENQLNEDLKRFLSPWAYHEGREPDFGGVIYRSAIVDFIEELQYVNYVKRTDIIHVGSASGDMAQAKSPASVLLSASKHSVTGQLTTESVEQLNIETIAFC